jgi:hypothetical protein
MELTCTCDIMDVFMSKFRPCRWVCRRCQRIATETTHYHLSLTEHAVTLNSRACRTARPCRQYRLLAVCITPTAGGEKTLSLCFTLLGFLFVETLFGKINFPYLSPSRSLSVSLFVSRGFTMLFARHFEKSKYTASNRNYIIFLIDIPNYKRKQTPHL